MVAAVAAPTTPPATQQMRTGKLKAAIHAPRRSAAATLQSPPINPPGRYKQQERGERAASRSASRDTRHHDRRGESQRQRPNGHRNQVVAAEPLMRRDVGGSGSDGRELGDQTNEPASADREDVRVVGCHADRVVITALAHDRQHAVEVHIACTPRLTEVRKIPKYTCGPGLPCDVLVGSPVRSPKVVARTRALLTADEGLIALQQSRIVDRAVMMYLAPHPFDAPEDPGRAEG